MIEGAKETVKLVINAENTIINATTGTDIDPQDKEHRAIGIVAFSEAEVEINGNLYVNAGSAIATRGKALININKDKNADTISNSTATSISTTINQPVKPLFVPS